MREMLDPRVTGEGADVCMMCGPSGYQPARALQPLQTLLVRGDGEGECNVSSSCLL